MSYFKGLEIDSVNLVFESRCLVAVQKEKRKIDIACHILDVKLLLKLYRDKRIVFTEDVE